MAVGEIGASRTVTQQRRQGMDDRVEMIRGSLPFIEATPDLYFVMDARTPRDFRTI